MNEFEAASGLSLNKKKCVAVCLHPAGPLPSHAAMKIIPVPTNQPTRYLGVPVSAAPAVTAAWAATMRTIQVRVVLALHKTADVLQRCKLAAAIIVPKILFVARHVWPLADTVEPLDRAMHNFVWSGHFVTESGSGRKALLNRHHSQLRQDAGGVGEPNIRAELRAMAASTVATWAHSRAREVQTIGDVLLWHSDRDSVPRSVWITPDHLGGSAPTWKRTLWAMGSSILQHTHGSKRDTVEIDGITSVSEQAWRLRYKGVWRGGQWSCDFSPIATSTRLLRELQHDSHGHSDTRWLLMAQITGGGVLLGSTGTALNHHAVNLIAKPHSLIADVVAWTWTAPNIIQFRCVSVAYPMLARAADQFRDLCATLVANYPRILQRPSEDGMVTPYNHSENVWILRQSTTSTLMILESAAPQVAALETVATATRTLQWRHDRMGQALDGLPWKAVHKIAGSTSQQRRLLFIIKSNRLSGWDSTTNKIGCPHPGCTELKWCGTAHIMWECPAAQHVWSATTAAWRGLGAWPTTHSSTPWLDSVFGLSFPATPATVWSMTHMKALGSKARAVAAVSHSAILPVWRLQVLHGFQTIWRWRHSYRDTGRSLSTAAVTATLHHNRLRTTHDALRDLASWGADSGAADRAIVLRTTLQIFMAKPQPEPPPCSLADRTVLFFDGGSRGNPGPGGSGAVLVQLDINGIGMSIRWAGSASFANRHTTNNYAEYQGLIWGLEAAARHHVGRVHVVGDSAMILRQLRSNTPPRSAKLPLYAHARLLAGQIGVNSWQHHYRAYNKMADRLANQAMDRRLSAQDCFPTVNPQLERLSEFMANDMGHWISASSNSTHN